MIYQLIFVLIALFGIPLFQTNNKNHNIDEQKKRYIIFVCIIMVLQSGLRNLAVGADTYAYYLDFQSSGYSSWNELISKFILYYTERIGKDPGYPLLVKLFYSIIPDYRYFLIAVAAFFFYSLGKLIYKYLNNIYEIFLGVLVYQTLFYEFFSITGIRQTIATGLALLSIKYAVKHKIIPFILIILFASTIHKSVFLFFIFYILCYLKNSKILLTLSALGFIPMWLFGKAISSALITQNFDNYAVYLQGSENAGAYGFTAFIIIIFILILVKYRVLIFNGRDNYIFINAIGVGLFLTPLTAIDPSNMRIVQYFSIFIIIIIPQIIYNFTTNPRINQNLRSLFIIVFISLMIMRSQPYAFAWQEMALGDNYKGYKLIQME